MQRRKQLTVRERQEARVDWRAFNLRKRQQYLHSSQLSFEDYIDYIQGYYVSGTQTRVEKQWTPPKLRETQRIPSSTSVQKPMVSRKDNWEYTQEKLKISKSYPIMPVYNKGPYMVIPVEEVREAGKK
jgi:hypothetical protein